MHSLLLRSLRLKGAPKPLQFLKSKVLNIAGNNENHNYQIVRGMANHRHKKMVKLAKGYRGRANRCYSVAKLRVMKARQYAYRDRKVKKRDFRKLWIQRINAACRIYGIAYSSFIHGLNRSHISLNRKVLSDIAITEPLSFRSVIEVVKQSLNEFHAAKKSILNAK